MGKFNLGKLVVWKKGDDDPEQARKEYEKEEARIAKKLMADLKGKKNNRFQQKHTEKAPKKKDLGKMTTVLGDGFSLTRKDKAIRLEIPDSHRAGGFWCFGTTRSGKSRLLENIVCSDIRKGYNTVIFDPKGDGDLFNAVTETAISCGRKEDLTLVTPIFPQHSAIIDPLASYYLPEELVAHITAGVSVGKDPYYYNVAYEMALAIVQSLIHLAHQRGEQPLFNLKEVERYVSYEGLSHLRSLIDSLDQDKTAQEISQFLGRILSTPPDFFSKVGSSLRVALSELTNGHIGKIIGKADDNRFLKRLENGQGVIMVVQLGALLSGRAAQTTAKVVLSMIQTYVGRIQASHSKMSPPLTVHIDEAQSCIHPNFPELISKCGSANCFLGCYNQSISQLFDTIGEDKTYSILDNANTKIFLRVPDSDTAHYVSGHLGERKVYSPIVSFGGGLSIRETEDVMVKTSEVLGLAPREFFLMTYNGIFRGKTLDVKNPRLKVQFPVPNIIRKIQ